MTKLWDKGYDVNEVVEQFATGEDFCLDRQLVEYDCLASQAHARTLGRAGVLTTNEVEELVEALDDIIRQVERGQFEIRPGDEDCHTAIELALTRRLGDLGRKIHTARSRNDQVLAALRLLTRDRLSRVRLAVVHLAQSLQGLAARHPDTWFPGYTHTRKAMPASIAMWAGAFSDSMLDNVRFLDALSEIVDQCPLGSGAGYGVPLEVDRQYTSDLLRFPRVQVNPIYVQNSRLKFELAILNGLGMVMYDLHKMASDLIFFSLPELGYVDLPENLCTGSSIMPQKKNPDVLELVRARYHELEGSIAQVRGLASGLISGYHRDFQLSKGPFLNALQWVPATAEVMKVVIDDLKVNPEKCRAGLTPDVYATHDAYELVKQGVPFREAYRIVAERFRQSDEANDGTSEDS